MPGVAADVHAKFLGTGWTASVLATQTSKEGSAVLQACHSTWQLSFVAAMYAAACTCPVGKKCAWQTMDMLRFWNSCYIAYMQAQEIEQPMPQPAIAV